MSNNFTPSLHLAFFSHSESLANPAFHMGMSSQILKNLYPCIESTQLQRNYILLSNSQKNKKKSTTWYTRIISPLIYWVSNKWRVYESFLIWFKSEWYKIHFTGHHCHIKMMWIGPFIQETPFWLSRIWVYHIPKYNYENQKICAISNPIQLETDWQEVLFQCQGGNGWLCTWECIH